MFLERFVPKQVVSSVHEIDPAWLREKQLSGIITDLDNTLIAAKETEIDSKLAQWLENMKRSGIPIVILSNNKKSRVAAFADAHGIPYIPRAYKPARKSFAMAIQQLEMEPEQVLMLGDQLLTDVLGGNRMGLYTVLVQPISPIEGVGTRINRVLERMIMYLLKRRGKLPGERQTRIQ